LCVKFLEPLHEKGDFLLLNCSTSCDVAILSSFIYNSCNVSLCDF
jgi:hypothetical protein